MPQQPGPTVRKRKAALVGAAVVLSALLIYLATRRSHPDESRPTALSAPKTSATTQPKATESAGGSTSFTLPERVTFSEHIAPIVYDHCARCHRPGEPGPFPLLNYRDVAARAVLIRAATQARYMPPWPADPSYRHFTDENVLTEEQIALIGRWVDQGSPRGDHPK
jgi:hypothetical protein